MHETFNFGKKERYLQRPLINEGLDMKILFGISFTLYVISVIITAFAIATNYNNLASCGTILQIVFILTTFITNYYLNKQKS